MKLNFWQWLGVAILVGWAVYMVGKYVFKAWG